MLTTVFPQRFQMEPLDLNAFDAWQDREAMIDASSEAQRTWRDWSKAADWRALRRGDLRPAPLEPLRREWLAGMTAGELAGMRRARALGARHGLCNAAESRAKTPLGHLDGWRRWKGRVVRADADVWFSIWPLLDGEPLAVVADWHSVEPTQLGRAVRLAFTWLSDELYAGVIR